MARIFSNLAYLLLGLIIGGAVTLAHADSGPAAQGYINVIYPDGYFSTGLVACQDANTHFALGKTNITWQADSSFPATDGHCFATGSAPPSNFWSSTKFQYYCPSGATLSGSTCTYSTACPAGQIRNSGGSCVTNCTLNTNDKLGLRVYFLGSVSNSTVCSDSCVYNIGGTVTACGANYCASTYQLKTGANCGSEPAGLAGATTEQSCVAQGKSFITFNGVTTCVAPSSSGAATYTKTDPVSTSSTAAGGNTTNVSNTTNQTVNNSTVTTTTTTTTSVNGGTPTTQTQTTTDSTDSYCAKNPNDALCKQADKGSYSGSCSSGFSCDGDAVECAIAKEQYTRNCSLFDTATSLSNLGNQVTSGNDPNASQNPALNSNSQVIDVSSSLNEDAHFSSSGLTDLTVATGRGPSVTVPFSRLNSTLQIMGYILLALAYVAAGRIVGVY